MARPYDAATKDLLETDPASLLRYLGLQVSGPVIVRNSDLTTVVAESDRIFMVDENPPWLAHVEIQSSAETDLELRIDRYNLLIEYRERMSVISAVLLLRPEAESPGLSGLRVQRQPKGEIYREFRYHVVRAWQQPLQMILEGPLATLPLATLADVREEQISKVIEKLESRLSEAPNNSLANKLRTDAMILMGLRYSEEIIRSLPWRTDKMRESTIYQAILKEGREEGREEGQEEMAKRLILRMGTTKFGEPSASTRDRLNAIKDQDLLEQLAERIYAVADWEKLLSQ